MVYTRTAVIAIAIANTNATIGAMLWGAPNHMMIYSDEDRSYLLCLAKGRKCGGANTKEDATKGLIPVSFSFRTSVHLINKKNTYSYSYPHG